MVSAISVLFNVVHSCSICIRMSGKCLIISLMHQQRLLSQIHAVDSMRCDPCILTLRRGKEPMTANAEPAKVFWCFLESTSCQLIAEQ